MNKIKKLSFLAVAFAALTLSSCSKEAEGKNEGSAPGEKATISLSFVNNMNTRTATAAPDTDDEQINDASVFVFRASGANDASRSYISGFASDVAQTIDATTAAKKVYVVANIGNEAAHEAMFSSVVDEASLNELIKDRIASLYDLNDGAGKTNIKPTDVLMTGVGAVGEFTATASPSAVVDVNLAFPLSKIQLIVKDNRINNMEGTAVANANDIAIINRNVVLINAGKSVKFFSSLAGDQEIQTTFYTGKNGVDSTDGFRDYFSSDAITSTDIWLGENTGTSTSTPSNNNIVTHHFYTAANNGANNPTILAIEAIKVTWNETAPQTTTVYFPIQFTAADAKQTLKPGKSYTVTLTLNGDISAGGGAGVVDPEVPVVDGSVTATITVAAWETIVIDKEL